MVKNRIIEAILNASIIACIPAFGFGCLMFMAENDLVNSFVFFVIMYILLMMPFAIFCYIENVEV